MSFPRNIWKGLLIKKAIQINKMKIHIHEVEKVAHLARLHLSECELSQMTKQLDNILNYIEKLNEIDTANVEPTTHVLAVSNAFREDLIEKSLDRSDVLLNAPKHDDQLFKVPKII